MKFSVLLFDNSTQQHTPSTISHCSIVTVMYIIHNLLPLLKIICYSEIVAVPCIVVPFINIQTSVLVCDNLWQFGIFMTVSPESVTIDLTNLERGCYVYKHLIVTYLT